MQRYLAAFFLFGVLANTTACGDKLNPGIAEEDPNAVLPTDGTTNPNTPASDANAVTNTDPNTAVTNPNATTNPNTPVTTPTPTPTPTPTGLCGTTATTISYATHVKPLLAQKCASCHGSGGNSPTMDTYAQAKAAFSTGQALEQVDSGQMPQGAPLTDNQLCIFDKWAKTSYAQ